MGSEKDYNRAGFLIYEVEADSPIMYPIGCPPVDRSPR